MTDEQSTEAMIREARGFGRPGWTHSFADCFRMIADLADRLASLSAQLGERGDLTTPYTPTAIYNEAADMVSFALEDVPVVVRHAWAHADVLLSLDRTRVLGWQINSAKDFGRVLAQLGEPRPAVGRNVGLEALLRGYEEQREYLLGLKERGHLSKDYGGSSLAHVENIVRELTLLRDTGSPWATVPAENLLARADQGQPVRHTMTITLTDAEREALEKLAAKKDLPPERVLAALLRSLP